MGVTNLWTVLEPAKQHKPLDSLKGQTLAVDLSIWIVENQGVKGLQAAGVTKPHLRNLFFRVSNLIQLGINLVFVIEGEPPELKWQTMASRQQSTWGARGKKSSTSQPRKQTRPQFKAKIRECCEMLDYLGIPYVQAEGEAEAMCAQLNKHGLVDACITDDGDAFLYGAQTIYKNFTLNIKDPHVESYAMSDVERLIGLKRNNLVAMALLLGCDYIPKGVPGIGKEQAMKLMRELSDINVLERFKEWVSTHFTCEGCSAIELNVRKKAIIVSQFPDERVVCEFMISRDRCPSRIQKWKRPNMQRLQLFNYDKLEWAEFYTQEKVLPLATLWDMQDITRTGQPDYTLHFQPQRVVKARVRQGIPCYEVEWVKPPRIKIVHVDDNIEIKPWITIEEKEAFEKCFAEFVMAYEEGLKTKKTRGKKTAKQKNSNIEQLTTQLDDINIGEQKLPSPKQSGTAEAPCLKTEEITASVMTETARSSQSVSNGAAIAVRSADMRNGQLETKKKTLRKYKSEEVLTKKAQIYATRKYVDDDSLLLSDHHDDMSSDKGNETKGRLDVSLLPLSQRIRMKSEIKENCEPSAKMNTNMSSVSTTKRLEESNARKRPLLDDNGESHVYNSTNYMAGLKTNGKVKMEKCSTDTANGSNFDSRCKSTPNVARTETKLVKRNDNLLFLSPVANRCSLSPLSAIDGITAFKSPNVQAIHKLDNTLLSPIVERCIFTPCSDDKMTHVDKKKPCKKSVNMKSDNVFVTPIVESTSHTPSNERNCSRMFCDESSISLFDISVDTVPNNSTVNKFDQSCDHGDIQKEPEGHSTWTVVDNVNKICASNSLYGDFNLQTSLLNNLSASFHNISVRDTSVSLHSASTNERLCTFTSKSDQARESQAKHAKDLYGKPQDICTRKTEKNSIHTVSEIDQSLITCETSINPDDIDTPLCYLTENQDGGLKYKNFTCDSPVVNTRMHPSNKTLVASVGHVKAKEYQSSPISLADRLKARLSKTGMSSVLKEVTNTK